MTKLAPPVIYRDLKCSNILLDEGYHPKLSDFGLAKLGPVGDNTHVSTRVMGTYGYCAPEYAMTGQLTLKSDVYSFGVVLLEKITGRKAIKNSKTAREHNLVAWLLIRRRRNHKQENKFFQIGYKSRLHSSPTNEIDVQQLAVEKKIKQAKEINIRDLLTNPSPIMENTLYYFQATIDDVEKKDQPWYDGCRVCNKRLTETREGLECYKCDTKNAESIPRYHIRLEVIDGNDKAIVILFDEPATSLIGCIILDYINSVRKDKFTSHFYKKMVSCKSMQYKFLFNSNRVTHSATGQTLTIIAQGIEAAQADNFAKINEAETHETKKKRQLKKKIVEAIDAVEPTPIEDEDINKSNPNEKELIEIEDDENLNAFYKRQKQIPRKKKPTILKKKIKLENV
ncbi:hypothetical protein F0562_030428 [Nyssa sinensis]|uniref:Protein kinase domain-containing protein n=1 Tax=Nyssa sinensis TaxID=561372 RepID=A0A5J5B2R4_9ASTE|nr:hypothetical protein F0562_030428 [Nyssa sinensis]